MFAVFAPPVQIEVPEFLTTFFKISAIAKGLASRSDSAAKLKEYRTALKVEYGKKAFPERDLVLQTPAAIP